MKKLLLLLGVCACLWSCNTSRGAYSDDIYDEADGYVDDGLSTEEFILAELAASLMPQGDCTRRLLDEAYTWKGTPYVYGGHSKKGTDCSGFTMEVFSKALGIAIPRNSAKQSEACRSLKKSELIPGDLVFFNGRNNGRISHVGIYIGGGKMIHASSSRGVIITGLDEPYFKKRYAGAGRVPKFEQLLKKK